MFSFVLLLFHINRIPLFEIHLKLRVAMEKDIDISIREREDAFCIKISMIIFIPVLKRRRYL